MGRPSFMEKDALCICAVLMLVLGCTGTDASRSARATPVQVLGAVCKADGAEQVRSVLAAARTEILAGDDLTQGLNALLPAIALPGGEHSRGAMSTAAWRIFFQNAVIRVASTGSGPCVGFVHNPVLAVGLVTWWESRNGTERPSLGVLSIDERLYADVGEAPSIGPPWIDRIKETGDPSDFERVTRVQQHAIQAGFGAALARFVRLDLHELAAIQTEAALRVLSHAERTRADLEEKRVRFLESIGSGKAAVRTATGDLSLHDLFGDARTQSLNALHLDALLLFEDAELYVLSEPTDGERFLILGVQLDPELGTRRVATLDVVRLGN